jgi:hypothetical protein
MTCSASIHSEPRRTRRHKGQAIKSRSAFTPRSFLAGVLDPERIPFERVRVSPATGHWPLAITGRRAYLLAGRAVAGRHL